jgi:hypothetical protein
MKSQIELLRDMVAGSTSLVIEDVALAFKSELITHPNYLLPEKPNASQRGRAWAGYYASLGVEVDKLKSNITLVGRHFEKVDVSDPQTIMTQLDKFRAEDLASKLRKQKQQEADGTALTNRLETLSEVIKEIEENLISPTTTQREKYSESLDRLTALQESFMAKELAVAS